MSMNIFSAIYSVIIAQFHDYNLLVFEFNLTELSQQLHSRHITILIKYDFFHTGERILSDFKSNSLESYQQAIPKREDETKSDAANFFDESKRNPIFLLAFDVSIIGGGFKWGPIGPLLPLLSSLKFICQRFTAPSFSPDDSDFSAVTWRGSRLSSAAQWARTDD